MAESSGATVTAATAATRGCEVSYERRELLPSLMSAVMVVSGARRQQVTQAEADSVKGMKAQEQVG